MRAPMLFFQTPLFNFATAVSYTPKMFIKFDTSYNDQITYNQQFKAVAK